MDHRTRHRLAEAGWDIIDGFTADHLPPGCRIEYDEAAGSYVLTAGRSPLPFLAVQLGDTGATVTGHTPTAVPIGPDQAWAASRAELLGIPFHPRDGAR